MKTKSGTGNALYRKIPLEEHRSFWKFHAQAGRVPSA
jgi:hypothetical protein